jgi:hypothetical protein
MNCRDYGCNKGYQPAREYIGRESDDVPPLGYSHDFLSMLAIWVVGLILGIVGTIYFLLV